jgi:valyl-tRNA synthetase
LWNRNRICKKQQWFIKYLDLKKDLLKWGKELNWHPKYMKTRYDNWVKGLQWDWLISNQRYFGVAFPVWYCGECEEVILAKESQLPVDPIKDMPPVSKCPKCGSRSIIPEADILNTWFTSSMTPQIIIELVKDKETRKKLFPMNLRPQAHEIISFWLFNTLLKSRLHFGENPWKDVAISGFVTLQGEKMSKSKGNVIAPQDVLKKYGADAMRYWAASSKLGEDFDYQEKDLITGKKLVTKLLNASRFVFMNLNYYKPEKPLRLCETDRIFLIKLNELIKKTTESFENYEYSKAKLDVENFFWKDFADNYLEIVKNRVYGENRNDKDSAFYTLYNTLLALLKMFAPFIPFITEEIYQRHFKEFDGNRSIHISEWPKEINITKKKEDSGVYDLLLETIGKIRQEKSKAKKSVKAEIRLELPEKDYKIFERNNLLDDLEKVVNAREIVIAKKGEGMEVGIYD